MKRDYCIGSQWLYYKIYTGVKTANLVLEKLMPLIAQLKTENKITKWFFIRYRDPEEHLRLRFYNENKSDLLAVITALYPVLEEMLAQNSIWKIQTDTYQPEIERYGETTMALSETLFCYDSERTVAYINQSHHYQDNHFPLLFSFRAIDSFLDLFAYTHTQKYQLFNVLQKSFKEEFEATATLKKEMDKQYRALYPEIAIFLAKTPLESDPEIDNIINHCQKESQETALAVQKTIKISLDDFLMSHIHMMINRQYTSRQRRYECLIYDHLHRYYKSKQYQLGDSSEKNQATI